MEVILTMLLSLDIKAGKLLGAVREMLSLGLLGLNRSLMAKFLRNLMQ